MQMAGSEVMEIVAVDQAIEWQARHAEEAGAPNTGRVIRALLSVLDGNTATGRRIANWAGLSLRDAMPLRIAGGLHNLVLTGADTRLADVYAGRLTRQQAIDELVSELVETYDARLLPWLDGPPQTNEAGRSASFIAALHWLSGRVEQRFALYEIGSSAGVNAMIDRYHYDLGGVASGPEKSPMRIAPEWRGAPPPDDPFEIVSICGCDQAPVDLSDPEAALRLKSYVWPEALGRMQRIDAAIELANERKPDVVKQDAADFVDAFLAEPPRAGVTRALIHSIVWQYIPDDRQDRISEAMERAGRNATPESPLAWIALETNRKTFRHELRVRYWPGGEKAALLGCAHPHGEWVEWLAD